VLNFNRFYILTDFSVCLHSLHITETHKSVSKFLCNFLSATLAFADGPR
jgi:hypothetical protein